jgi:PKD repeat protein
MKHILILLLLLALVLPVFALDEGTTIDGDSKIILDAGNVTVGDSRAGVDVTSYMKINGVKFTPINTVSGFEELTWDTGEKIYFIFDDPILKAAYTFNNNVLKETITIKEPKALSFPVSLSEGSSISSIDGGRYKIYKTLAGIDSRGIVIEKPYGIDASGRFVPMEYSYSDSTLFLNYAPYISINNVSEVSLMGAVPIEDRVGIVYPLVIDPTYTIQPLPSVNKLFINATNSYPSQHEPLSLMNNASSLIGSPISEYDQMWLTNNLYIKEIRLTIDLGEAKIIRNVTYNNGHLSGTVTNRGAKNFVMQGSNSDSYLYRYKMPEYENNTGWTNLTTSVTQFAQHAAVDVADNQSFLVTNTNAYRYYSFKIADNWGSGNYISMRRLQLLTEDTYSTPAVLLTLTSSPTISGVYATNVAFNATGNASVNPHNWTFGDGYTSTVRNNINHYFSVAGNYTVNLSTTNQTEPFGFVNATVYLNQTSDVDSKLISRMHMNGADGGTTFTAERGSAWTPTSVTTETAQKKFGTASALFNAAGDRLQTPTSNAFDFGTSNFTLGQWVFPTSSGSEQMILSRTTNGNTRPDGWGIYHSTASATSDGWRFWMGTTATQTGTFTLPLNTWSHLVVQRDGAGNVVVYVDGVSVATVTAAGNYDTINAIVYGDPIGGGAAVDSWRGYLDETGISTTTRWLIDGGTPATFSPPYAEYRGDLFPAYPDINPGSTLRFKTNPSAPPSAALISNLTARQRTLQIQYINQTNNISTVMLFNPMHFYADTVTANATTFTGINFTKVIIDNAAGTALINATRPGGFTTIGLVENRASFADIRMVYYNYTEPEEDAMWDDDDKANVQGFGSGFLRNLTNGVDYPVANFIATNVSVVDWQTFSNFSVSNIIPNVSETNVLFRTLNNNFTANRFDWDFGDGYVQNTTFGNASHMYFTPGTYNVSSRAYLWQNNSVTNISVITNAIVAAYNLSYVKANFTATPVEGSAGLMVSFTDTSYFETNTGKKYNWDWGDSTTAGTAVGKAYHVYPYLGIFTVNLTVNNTLNWDSEIKTDYITINVDQNPQVQSFPHYTTFHLKEGFGTPVAGVAVLMTPINTSLGDYGYLNSLIGIPISEVPLDTMVMSEVSDDEGRVTFYTLPTTKYNITFTKAGYTFTPMVLVPQDDDYIIWPTSTTSEFYRDGVDELSAINFTVTSTLYSPSVAFLNMTYLDTTGHTTGGTIRVIQKSDIAWDPPTVMAEWPVTGFSFSNSTAITHVQQVSGYIEANVTHSDFGQVVRSYPYSFNSVPVQFLGFGQDITLIVALGIMMMTMMLGGASHSRIMIIIVDLEGWIFYSMHWFQSLFDRGVSEDLFGTALLLVLIVGILANILMRKKRGL